MYSVIRFSNDLRFRIYGKVYNKSSIRTYNCKCICYWGFSSNCSLLLLEKCCYISCFRLWCFCYFELKLLLKYLFKKVMCVYEQGVNYKMILLKRTRVISENSGISVYYANKVKIYTWILKVICEDFCSTT